MAVLDTSPTNVIIVGGGISGLVAAKILSNAKRDGYPLDSITILEADQVLGGRAETIEYAGMALDTGCHWGHGAGSNAFFTWIRRHYGMPENSFRVDGLDNIKSIIDGKIEDGDFRNKGYALLEQAYEAHIKLNSKRDISLGDLASSTNSDIAQLTALFMARNWMGRQNPYDISCHEFFGDPAGSGGYQSKKGFGHIIKKMADDLIANGVRIELNTRITSVTRSLGNMLLLEDGSGKKHGAGWCLVTVPVAVLKRGDIHFDTDVTAKLKPRLDHLSVAYFNKAFVPVRPDFFDECGIAPNTRTNVVRGGHSFFTHARTAGKPVITLMMGGHDAIRMEEMTSDQATRFIGDSFREVPSLKGWDGAVTNEPYVTGWVNHDLSRASYTALKPSGRRQDPLFVGQLGFVGEAWIANPRSGPSTLAGAFASGRSGARTIVGHVAKRRGFAPQKPRPKGVFTPVVAKPAPRAPA